MTSPFEASPCRCAAGQYDAPMVYNVLTTRCLICRHALVSHEGGAALTSNLLRGPAATALSRAPLSGATGASVSESVLTSRITEPFRKFVLHLPAAKKHSYLFRLQGFRKPFVLGRK